MTLKLTYTQRLSINAIMGQIPVGPGVIKDIWNLMDKIALSPEEEKEIDLTRTTVNGSENIKWDAEKSLPDKEVQLTASEVIKLRNSLLAWPTYSPRADRVWYEPLMEVLEKEKD